MDPYSGTPYEIREELLGNAKRIGEALDMAAFKQKIEELGSLATLDERLAAKAPALVRIEEEAARRLALGAREQERRKKRRKAEKRARRTQH